MAIENLEEVIQYLNENKENQDLSTALETNGFIKEVEKEASYTEDGVNKFISENQGFGDKLYNKARDNVYKKLLGLEKTVELTEEPTPISVEDKQTLLMLAN